MLFNRKKQFCYKIYTFVANDFLKVVPCWQTTNGLSLSQGDPRILDMFNIVCCLLPAIEVLWLLWCVTKVQNFTKLPRNVSLPTVQLADIGK